LDLYLLGLFLYCFCVFVCLSGHFSSFRVRVTSSTTASGGRWWWCAHACQRRGIEIEMDLEEREEQRDDQRDLREEPRESRARVKSRQSTRQSTRARARAIIPIHYHYRHHHHRHHCNLRHHTLHRPPYHHQHTLDIHPAQRPDPAQRPSRPRKTPAGPDHVVPHVQHAARTSPRILKHASEAFSLPTNAPWDSNDALPPPADVSVHRLSLDQPGYLRLCGWQAGP
jgi:hypothetical protein